MRRGGALRLLTELWHELEGQIEAKAVEIDLIMW